MGTEEGREDWETGRKDGSLPLGDRPTGVKRRKKEESRGKREEEEKGDVAFSTASFQEVHAPSKEELKVVGALAVLLREK